MNWIIIFLLGVSTTAFAEPLVCKGAGFRVELTNTFWGWGNGYKVQNIYRNGRPYVTSNFIPPNSSCVERSLSDSSMTLDCTYMTFVELEGTLINLESESTSYRGSLEIAAWRARSENGTDMVRETVAWVRCYKN